MHAIELCRLLDDMSDVLYTSLNAREQDFDDDCLSVAISVTVDPTYAIQIKIVALVPVGRVGPADGSGTACESRLQNTVGKELREDEM